MTVPGRFSGFTEHLYGSLIRIAGQHVTARCCRTHNIGTLMQPQANSLHIKIESQHELLQALFQAKPIKQSASFARLLCS